MAVEHHPRNNSSFSLVFLTAPKAGMEWIVAGFLTVLWLSALLTYGAGYFGIFDGSAADRGTTMLEVMLYLCALILPVAACWIGAFFVSQTVRIREDAQSLRWAVHDLKSAMTLQSPAGRQDMLDALTKGIDDAVKGENKRVANQMRQITQAQLEIAQSVKKLMAQSGAEKQEISKLVETAQDVAEKATRKVAAVNLAQKSGGSARSDADTLDQNALPFEDDTQNAASAKALDWEDLNRALNFPKDEDDQVGFAAIRRVLPHRNTAQLLQSAEDVLSMLAQEGIYMDDLTVAPANPDLWRKFAMGTRGDDIADMGTADDQAALALVRGRMRTDETFKDRSLTFLRLFDRVLSEFQTDATDRDLVTLAGTRSGLAFLLLARANGTFN